MPISSTDVQNILSAQVGMFSSAAQYAQAVSNQYGYQPGGGGGVDDPRNSAALMGGMVASGATRALSFGGNALGMAAMMGAAPRIFDPFTATMGAGAAGYNAAGMAGAIGAGVATGGAYLALSSIYRWTADQVVTGAQQRGMLNYQLGQMAPGMGVGQLGQMSAMVSGAARMGMGSIQDINGMLQAGAADGSLNTQSLTQFQQSFQKLLGNVRQVASALSVSLTEAQQAMQQVKAIGVSSDQAGQFLGSMRMIGQGAGLTPQQMYGIAAQGTAFGRQMGINPQGAAMGAMINQGVLGMVEKGGLIEGVGMDSYGRYSQGAMRFLGSAPGQRVLAAMMNQSGQLDPTVAGQMAMGLLSREQIQQMATTNLGRRGMRDMLNARSGELAGEFLSQYGPQAIAPSLQAMTSGGMYGQNPESMRAMLTGLNRNEIAQMGNLNQLMPGLRSRLMEAGREGFQEGIRRPNFTEALGANIEQLVAPFKDRLRQFGADLSQSAQQIIENVTRDFMGGPTPGADPTVYSRYINSYLKTGLARNPMYQRMQPFMGGNGGMAPSIPQAQSFLGGMPTGLRMGSMAPGVGFGDLPFNGFGTESYNPYMTGLAGSAFFGVGGRSFLGHAGQALGQFGLGITEATAGGATGFMGLGGYGLATGTARLGGYALRGAGAVARGVGVLGTGLLAYDAATNLGPALSRGLGFSPISEGAVLGEQARLLEYMSANNIGGVNLEERKVGYLRGGMVGGDTGDYMPVGGLTRSGYQNFIGPQSQQAFQRFSMVTAPQALSKFERDTGDRGSRALFMATRSYPDIDRQAQDLMRRIPGLSSEQAKTILAGSAASPFSGQNIQFFNEVEARENLVSTRKLVVGKDNLAKTVGDNQIFRPINDLTGNAKLVAVGANNRALQAMQTKFAASKGLPTLDVFLETLESKLGAVGVGLDSDEARAEILGYLTQLDPSERVQNGIAANMISKGQTSFSLTGLRAMSDARAAYLQGKEDKRRLAGEQAEATSVGMNAAQAGMFSSSAITTYVGKFSEGDFAGRNEALSTMFGELIKDPTVKSKGLGIAIEQAAKSPTEAMQRFGIGAITAARYKRLQDKGGMVDARKYLEQVVGVDLSNVSRETLNATFSKTGRLAKESLLDPSIKAMLVNQLLEEQRAGLRLGEQVNVTRAEEQAGNIEKALAEQARDPARLQGATQQLSTQRAQAGGSGGRPGETAKNVEELISRLGRFGESVENAKRKLDTFSDNTSR